MNKKGLLAKQWLYIFYIALNIIVAVLFVNFVNELVENQRLNPDFLVRDLGLNIDVLHNAPNKITLNYINPVSYDLKINKDAIEIIKVNQGQFLSKKYLYTHDNNIEINVNINAKKDSTLVFIKDKNIVVSINE